MALGPSSASTAPVTLPTRVPCGECSGTVSNWYWGLPFCRGEGYVITGGPREARFQLLPEGPRQGFCEC